jgi:hypothetical protein
MISAWWFEAHIQIEHELQNSRSGGPGTSTTFNLAVIMDVLGALGEIAHIKPLRADRALFEMIGLTLSDAVGIGAGVAWKLGPHDHSSSRSRM